MKQRIRFLSEQIYETGGQGKGPKFAKGFVLDGEDVGTVLGITAPTPEYIRAFLERWVRRGVAEYVDGRAQASDPDEVVITDEAPPPVQVSQPLGTAQRGAPTPGLDDGKQVPTSGNASDPATPDGGKIDLEKLTRAELDALAADRGVDISQAKNKSDVIAALQAAGENSGSD